MTSIEVVNSGPQKVIVSQTPIAEPFGLESPIVAEVEIAIPGTRGPKGDPGEAGVAGPVGLNWQGPWSALVDYVNNDAVSYDGSGWFAVGNPPMGEIPSEESVYWDYFSKKGDPGPAGDSADLTEVEGDITTLFTRVGDTATLETQADNLTDAVNEVKNATPDISGSTIKYIGDVEPDGIGWEVDDLWYDTSTEG